MIQLIIFKLKQFIKNLIVIKFIFRSLDKDNLIP